MNWVWQNNQVKIVQVLSGRSNAWLLLADNLSILVDTGKASSFDKIFRNIRKTGLNPEQLDYLFLTHTHFDHCQSAARIRDLSGCRIMASVNAKTSVSTGYTELPKGALLPTRFISMLGRSIGRKRFGYPPFLADFWMEEPKAFGFNDLDIRIIETPGHSPDSISLIVQNEVAIVGDALFGIFPNSVFPPYADDVPQLIGSWGKLLDTGCSLFLPGHGRPINRDFLEKEFGKYHRN